MNRRDFFGRAAALAAGAAMGGSALQPESLRAMTGFPSRRSIDSWGVQLYTIRSVMEDVPSRLADVAAIGFREVELAGIYGYSPQDFRGLLDAAGLRATSTHVGIEQLQGDLLEGTIETAHTLGNEWIIVPSLPREYMASPDGMRSVATALTHAGHMAGQHGIGVGFHNHAGEWQPFEDGQVPMDILLAESDPSVVSFQMDIFWTVHAGVDPLARLERDPGRYVSVHVKDRTADGNMVNVGQGVIDFAAILPRAQALGVRHFYVEHDRPESPMEDIASSYHHLHAILG